MRGIALSFALDQVLGRIPSRDADGQSIGPVTYVVRGGQVVIRPASTVRTNEEMRADPAFVPEFLREPVVVSQDERPLKDVLKELAEATGANIVLDVRAKDVAQARVTANLQQVPLETAVRLLADQVAGPELVVQGLRNHVRTAETGLRLRIGLKL